MRCKKSKRLLAIMLVGMMCATSAFNFNFTYADESSAGVEAAAQTGVLDEVKRKFDSSLSALRPNFAKDKNIASTVEEMIKRYEGIDATGVTVSVESSSSEDVIALDGTINYIATSLGMNNSKNITCTFSFSKDGRKVTSENRTVTVGWDREYFNSKVNQEAENFTADSIKASNPSLDNVTGNLTLPQIMGTKAREAWSKVTWTSSDEKVISVKSGGIDVLTTPKQGVVTRAGEDKTVTLTATFSANDVVLNTNVEKVADFTTVTKNFTVVVKGDPTKIVTEDSLREILDKYYTADQLKYSVSGEKVDLNNVTGDIQLPLYTRIKDENRKNVFKNKEIAVTVENDKALSINGYRLNVDRFAANGNGKIMVTFTRGDKSVTKEFPLVVAPMPEDALDAEIALMEEAKANYFEGINDGRYRSEKEITGNLRSFMEMRKGSDGTRKWAYAANEFVGDGIKADDFFDDPWIMEGQGYNKFQSSNTNVVKHDNLNVTRGENSTEVTISSLLSSSKYGKLAQKHPDNAKLQKLYRQPVSVTVRIKGTASVRPALENKVQEAKELLSTMVEGNDPGQYAQGSKAALQSKIDEAERTLENSQSGEDAIEDKLTSLVDDIKAARNAQNPKEAIVSIRSNGTPNVYGREFTNTVNAVMGEKYGYEKEDEYKKEVTALDALVTMHEKMYGDEFKNDPQKYLKVGKNGFITRIYGIDTYNIGYVVNGKTPMLSDTLGSVANNTILKDKDKFQVFIYGDTTHYNDKLLFIDEENMEGRADDEFAVKLKSSNISNSPSVQTESGAELALGSIDEDGNIEESQYKAVTDENGVAKFRDIAPGEYVVLVKTVKYQHFIAPYCNIKVREKLVDTLTSSIKDISAKLPRPMEIGNITLNVSKSDVKIDEFAESMYAAYDIKLMNSDREIAVSDFVGAGESIEVSIPLNENLKLNKNIKLYTLDKTGALEEHEFKVDGDLLKFKTDHLSHWIVGERKQSEKQPEKAADEQNEKKDDKSEKSDKSDKKISSVEKAQPVKTGDMEMAMSIYIFMMALAAVVYSLCKKRINK